MIIKRILALVAALALAACEQVQMFGPIGGGTITITELRTGNEVATGNPLTFDADAVIATVGQEKFDGYNGFQKLTVLGINQFGDLPVDDNTWYLYQASGGFDYDADANNASDDIPTQVFGSVHAIVRGDRLKESGYVVSPLTEAVYQHVKDHVSLYNDDELGQLLDQVAAELVGDVFSQDEGVNYLDVLKWSRLFHMQQLQFDGNNLDSLAQSLAANDSAATLQDKANTIFGASVPDGVPEKIYEDSISDIITRPVNTPNEGGCGVGCHYPGGSGSLGSSNDLVPPTDPDYVALNTDNFRALVNNPSKGVSHVLNKVQGIGHGGGAPIPLSSSEYSAFEDWLNLL